MSGTVSIVDYGVGNLLSVARAVSKVGGTPLLVSRPQEIEDAERLLLPGVGAFGDCVASLRQHTGLEEALLSYAASGQPMLGICVGMQMLFEASEEFGEHRGLGLIPGRVRAIPLLTSEGLPHKVPHTGWAALELPAKAPESRWENSLLTSLRPNDAVYFVHSYSAHPEDQDHRLADVHYNGQRIAAAVALDNIAGTQFHPEKSGPAGLAVMAAFVAR